MLIVIKGAGDLASGIAYRLKKSGFDVVMTEIENPTTVRRTVAFSQAIFDNETIIEGIKGIKVNSRKEGKWTYYSISTEGSSYAGELLKKLTTINTDKYFKEYKCNI